MLERSLQLDKQLDPFILTIEMFILLTSTMAFFVGLISHENLVLQYIKITPLELIIIFILNTCLIDISLKL